MSATARYRIPDEPRPSAAEGLTVDPLWPLFAQMLVGSWLALPWFAANALFMGSPTRGREWGLAAASVAGSVALLQAIRWAWDAHWFAHVDVAYAKLAITVLKLGCAYALYMIQSRPFQLWKYFGGRPKNGLPLVILMMIIVEPEVSDWLGSGLLSAALR